MTDRTPDLTACLQARAAEPILHREYDISRLNTFLQEAYTLQSRITDLTTQLRSLRPSYLSTASVRRQFNTSDSPRNQHQQPLSDREKDEIDAQSKQILRELNQAITHVKQAEILRSETADQIALQKRHRGGLGALGRWAAGGGSASTPKSPEEEAEEAARNSVREHREAVIYYLQKRLEEAGKVQAEMMEVRLGREVERSKSVLHKTSVSGPGGVGIPYASRPIAAVEMEQEGLADFRGRGYDPAMEEESGMYAGGRQELTQEQRQVFEEENTELLKSYNAQLTQLSAAEKSIREISELQSTLVANISMQAEYIDQLVQDSYVTSENMGKGNAELRRAAERRSTAQGVFYVSVGLCGFLLLWDVVF